MISKKQKILFSLTIAALLLISVVVQAQDWRGKGRVNGTVTNEAGEPIEGVSVKLIWSKSGAGKTIKTGKDGKWMMNAIKGGTWNIDFTHPDYMPYATSAHVSEVIKTHPMKLVMQPAITAVGNEELAKELTEAEELFEAGSFAEALPFYQKAKEEMPELSAISQRIAECLLKTDDPSGALAEIIPVLEKSPENRAALNIAGDAAFAASDYSASFDYYDKLAELAETDAAAWANLGELCLMVDKYPRAVEAFGKTVELNPEHYDAYVKLSVVMQMTDDNKGALAILNKLKEVAPEDDPIFSMYPVDELIAQCEAMIG